MRIGTEDSGMDRHPEVNTKGTVVNARSIEQTSMLALQVIQGGGIPLAVICKSDQFNPATTINSLDASGAGRWVLTE